MVIVVSSFVVSIFSSIGAVVDSVSSTVRLAVDFIHMAR